MLQFHQWAPSVFMSFPDPDLSASAAKEETPAGAISAQVEAWCKQHLPDLLFAVAIQPMPRPHCRLGPPLVMIYLPHEFCVFLVCVLSV